MSDGPSHEQHSSAASHQEVAIPREVAFAVHERNLRNRADGRFMRIASALGLGGVATAISGLALADFSSGETATLGALSGGVISILGYLGYRAIRAIRGSNERDVAATEASRKLAGARA